MKGQVAIPEWFVPLTLVICIQVIIPIFALVGCATSEPSPARVSTQDYAIMNLSDELDRALARGDRVRKMPHGDYSWDWCEEGETWDFQRWHYEIVRP